MRGQLRKSARTKHTQRKRSKKSKTYNKRHHHDFIHKALYQKKNECGLGTYSKVDLPIDTVIVRETPVRLDEANDRLYPFRIIVKLLKDHRTDFMKLVPNAIDQHAKFDDDLIRDGKIAYFPHTDEDTLKLYYLKYKRNAFSFDGNPGILFYATRMNHSCEPNVTYYREGDQMVFKTKSAIRKGEEVFDSYISPNGAKSERQETLLRRYGFECQCCKCRREE